MVSVCIATYNGEKYIEEQLSSILKQIEPDDEVIISDDGSKDNTIDIIKSFNDNRISIVQNHNRHGADGNFENALKLAKGDIIFMADQDDVWLDNKYEITLQALADCDLVHSDSIVTDENLNTLYDSFYGMYNNGPGILKNIYRSTYFGSHMAFKKKILDYSFPFPQTVEIGHDLWIGLVAEMIGTVKFIDDKLLLYRRHADSHGGYLEHSKRSIWKRILGRIQMIYYVLNFRLRNIKTK